MNKVYKVKRSITLPLVLAVFLSLPVFALSIKSDAPTAKLVWTFVLMLLFYAFALNKILQRVSLTPGRIDFTSLLGRRSIQTSAIQSIDGASMGSRQFVILTTAQGAQHFSNSLEGFAELTAALKDATPPEIQASGLTELITKPIVNRRDALAPWIAVLVLVMLLIGRLQI